MFKNIFIFVTGNQRRCWKSFSVTRVVLNGSDRKQNSALKTNRVCSKEIEKIKKMLERYIKCQKN